MKIIVATMKGGLDDSVSQVFGRCAKFTIVEADGNEIKDTRVVENPSASAAGGAGIKAAQFVSSENAQYAVAGNFGPNASEVLDSSNVKMVQTQGGVEDTIKAILTGDLKPASKPTVESHFGMGRGGFGRGHGGGRNRGDGWGRR